jgi:hypothetical protein
MTVSLSSYCQYPVVKTIGKDTVVIMTVKQGDDINKKFMSLNDSLSALNQEILSLRQSVSSLGAKNIEIIKTYGEEISEVNKRYTKYRSGYENAEAEIDMLRREDKKAVWVMFMMLVGVAVYKSGVL